MKFFENLYSLSLSLSLIEISQSLKKIFDVQKIFLKSILSLDLDVGFLPQQHRIDVISSSDRRRDCPSSLSLSQATFFSFSKNIHIIIIVSLIYKNELSI